MPNFAMPGLLTHWCLDAYILSQTLAGPLRGVIVANGTGTGKTMGYLLGLFSLWRARSLRHEAGERVLFRPIIIMAPRMTILQVYTEIATYMNGLLDPWVFYGSKVTRSRQGGSNAQPGCVPNHHLLN